MENENKSLTNYENSSEGKKESKMSDRMKSELRVIIEDKIGYGSFCGMVFNQYMSGIHSGNIIDVNTLIEQALLVRLEAKNMADIPTLKEIEVKKEPEKPKLALKM